MGRRHRCRTALETLPERIDEALVVLGDGPALGPRQSGATAAAGGGVRAADYGRGRSHPVVLPRAHTGRRCPTTGDTPGASWTATLIDCSDLPEPGRRRLRGALTAAVQPHPLDQPLRHRIAAADRLHGVAQLAPRSGSARGSRRSCRGAARSSTPRPGSAAGRGRAAAGSRRPAHGSTLMTRPPMLCLASACLSGTAPAVQPRHDRPDRDAEDVRGVLVAEIADVDQHHHLAERRRACRPATPRWRRRRAGSAPPPGARRRPRRGGCRGSTRSCPRTTPGPGRRLCWRASSRNTLRRMVASQAARLLPGRYPRQPRKARR